MGHPASQEFTGQYLGEKIIDLCSDWGFTIDFLSCRLVGGAFDGQYLHLRVMEHIGLNFTRFYNCT